MTPEYIINNWTDEELQLFIEKHVKRHTRQEEPEEVHTIPDTMMLNQLGIEVERG